MASDLIGFFAVPLPASPMPETLFKPGRSESNRANMAPDGDKCIEQLFEAQVERTPNAVALAFADQEISYRELSQRVLKLSRELTKTGVSGELRVGLCADRPIEMLVGLLAIFKARGACVPLASSETKER